MPPLCRGGGFVVRRDIFARRLGLVDPGPEVPGQQVRKRQRDVAQVTFRVDGDDRDAVQRRLLNEAQTEARLARARHAHDERVAREVLGVVQNRRVRTLAVGGTDLAAEVKNAEAFERGGHSGR